MRFLTLALICFSTLATSQISFRDLKKAGIDSEEDLMRLGVEEDELKSLKSEYFSTEETPMEKPNNAPEDQDSAAPSEKENPIILESTKEELNEEFVYGQTLFSSGSVKIQKNSNRIKANANYIIGSGDRISVSIWGYSEYSDDFIVDDLGNISPRLVGRINLKGRSFKDAKSILKSKFSKVYDLRNSQIGIELSYSKVISINIMGEVVSPGTYSIPSINSAFNILSLSNGPNKMGSVRNISIVRHGKIINNLDIYEFMNSPGESSYIYLKNGDFIVVPPLGNIVSVNGEIQRPGKFETKSGETLKDLIEFAGNFKSSANKSNIIVLRKTSKGKVVKSYSIENAKDILVKNGDEVIVPKLSEYTTNKITIKGEVNGPGVFEFKPNENLESLLKRANGLTPEAYSKTAHIYRLNSKLRREIIRIDLKSDESLRKTQLMDLDELLIFNKKTFLDTNYIQINGLVRKPGKFEFRENMTLKDLITIVGGVYPQANLKNLEIERINFQDQPSDTINYVASLFKSLETDPNFKLEPYDIVNVRALPEFKFQEKVTIEGQVRYPGSYSLYNHKNRISDVIKRAGGLTSLSYGKKAYIYRTNDSLGLILLDLEGVLKNQKSTYNYRLLPGDKIFVPRINDIVSVSGAIGAKIANNNDKINVAYVKGKKASFYIKKYAGGYDYKANKRKVSSMTLNGQIKRSRFYGLIKPRVEPGDKIIVSYKQEKKSRNEKNKINWNDQIENISIKLTGLATLWLLASQISGL